MKRIRKKKYDFVSLVYEPSDTIISIVRKGIEEIDKKLEKIRKNGKTVEKEK